METPKPVLKPIIDWGSFKSIKPTMSRNDVADFMGTSLVTVDKWIRSEGFPYIKIGSHYRILTEKFLEWVENHIGEAV